MILLKLHKRAIQGALSLLLFGASSFTTHAFTHPGLPFTAADLDRVKANLNVEPWKTAYASLASSGQSQLTYVEQGPFQEVGRTPDVNRGAYVSDMTAMYNLSLMWWFTGNSAYADKAIGIIDGYATTHTIWSGAESYLTTGDALTSIATGSEILRTYSGWTPTIDTHVKNYFANMIWPQSGLPAPIRSANQGSTQLEIGMAAAVFCDDNTRFGQCLDAYRNNACGGLSNSLPNGQIGDTGRDQGHAWGELLNLTWVAEVAWKQGIDLYGEKNNRLLAACEYYSQFNLGYSTPFIQAGTCYDLYTSIGGTPTMSADMRMHNMIYAAYVTRKGLSAPYTTQWRNARTENSGSFVFRNAGGSQPAGPPAAATPASLIAPLAATALTSVDVGSVAEAGSSSYANGTWTIVGSGADIWGTSDGFRFAYKQLTGNGTIIAKVTGLTQSNVYAKAGIMIRETLAANSKLALLAEKATTSTDGGAEFFARLTTGGNPSNFQPHNSGMIPYWLKLVRNGDLITGYTSPDGVSWSAIQVVNLPMAATVYIGLAVTGHNNVVGGSGTGTFTNVSMDTAGGLMADGTYRIMNRNSGKAINVQGYDTTTNGKPLEEWTYNGNFSELWTLTELGGGKYRIIGLASSRAMDVSGNSTADGAGLIVWNANGGANEQFSFTATSGGYNRMTPVFSGKSVGVSGTDPLDTNKVDQWTYTGANNQQWSFQAP